MDVNMTKKILFSIILSIILLVFCLSASAVDTVYLSDGGNGNGLTKETPVGSLAKAYEILSGSGTIVIDGTYTMNAPFYEEQHTDLITITGGTFVMNHASYNRIYLAGPTTFENVKITMGAENTSKTAMFVAGYNPLVLGKGITVQSGLTIYVLGGYQLPASEQEYNHYTDRDSSVVVESGTWHAVVGFSRGSGTTDYTGTSNITINGGTIKSVYGASILGSYSGNTNITINGGTVNALYTGGDATRRINGNATVNINGGTVKLLSLNNVMGHTTVNFLGGYIENVSRSVSDNLKQFVTDGKIDLSVRKGLRVQSIMEFFDSATYEDGAEISGATDVDVATYTTLAMVPEKSTAHPAKIYVANVGDGSGFSPDSPISDLAKAYEMLRGIDGTIVLINTVELPDGFTEPKHEEHIVITSFDGERFFDGGIKFGKSKRFYHSGDTTFENTKLDFEGSLLFVGRFNNLVFGTGLTTPTTDVADTYVLGGYQLYESDNTVPHDVNYSITIESGNYYAVIGYTRGSELSGYTHTFNGTQTLNLLGGKIDRVYGGPIQASIGDNIVINIDGATIADWLMVGGDSLIYSNTATINMKSGHVEVFDIHNVIKGTTVNWTGGTIASMKTTYGVSEDGKVDISTLATDATYTLNYKGVEPTSEILALFDTVAELSSTTVQLTIGSTTAYINGEAQTLDAAPINRNNRTMLPVRFLANAFGVDNDGIKWDGATRTATLTNSEVTIVVTIDAPTMTVNGETIALDSPAIIENNRTYLPVRAIANALGVSNDNIAWDGATSTATLTK